MPAKRCTVNVDLGVKRGLWLVGGPDSKSPVFVHADEICVMEGCGRIFDRPDDCLSAWSRRQPRSAGKQLYPNDLHCGRWAELQRCECPPANKRWILVDWH